jgi:peptidoglycan hydrolase CwlO-like protein
LKQTNANLQARIEELIAQRNDEYNARLDEMRKAQKNLRSLRQEVVDTNRQIISLQANTKDRLEMGKQIIGQKVEELEKTLAEKDANIEELENRMRELKSTLEKIYNLESPEASNEV